MIKNYRGLIILDFQEDFINKFGNTPLKNLKDSLPSKLSTFIRFIPSKYYDFIIITMDTHFREFYDQTDEGKIYPLHADFQSLGWKLAFDPIDVAIEEKAKKVFYLYKDTYDIWKSDGVMKVEANIFEKGKFVDDERYLAYESIGTLRQIKNNETVSLGNTLENFIKEFTAKGNLEVTLLGASNDINTRYDPDHFLELGVKVFILEDLMLSMTTSVTEILQRNYYEKYKTTKQLLLSTMSGYLFEHFKINELSI